MADVRNEEASWRLKTFRAHEQLQEIKTYIEQVAGSDPRTLRVDHREEAGRWKYSIHHDVEISPIFAVVIGEFLFNLRSALDHVAVACGGMKAQFPIFREDPWERTESGAYIEARASRRNDWKNWTRSMPPAIKAIIKEAQPFQNAAKYGVSPADHALFILHEAQLADKHRELNVIVGAISPTSVIAVDGDGKVSDLGNLGIPVNSVLGDGGGFYLPGLAAHVEVQGTLNIAMTTGPGSAHRKVPDVLAELLDVVASLTAAIEDVM